MLRPPPPPPQVMMVLLLLFGWCPGLATKEPRPASYHGYDHHGHSHNHLVHNSTHISFMGKYFEINRWMAFQHEFLRWSAEGQWVFNMSMKIIDNITLYAPCMKHIRYGPKNPCAWILDFDVLKYYWEVNTTAPDGQMLENHLVPFNARRMCDMFDDGDVLFIGDSISGYMFDSWRNQFLVGLDHYECPASDKGRPYDEFSPQPQVYESGCPGQNIFVTCREDYFNLPVWNGTLPSNHTLYAHFPWVHVLNRRNIKLLILNRGAHYVEDNDFLFQLNNTLAYLTEMHPEVSIVWRNTYFGVYNNGKTAFAKPLHEVPLTGEKYYYNQFEHQNSLVYR
jgi:hypothetical protein